ncbi:MAG: MarR family transcriptional regulator [Actinomycetota bacterium]|nr:MarR family transcriptional regulator [Actinomycetota bacterium]
MSSPDVRRIPSAGGRLRTAHRAILTDTLARLHQAGFTDVTYAQIPLFRHEGPDGRRPGEIAATAELSKQAANDLLGQLERHGYLKREPHPANGRARLVHLTARGRLLDAAIWQAGRDIEQAWRERVGEPEWSVFREVLERLAQADPADPRREPAP